MKTFLCTIIACLSLLILPSLAHAQQTVSSGIATYLPIKEHVVPGDIVKLSKDGYELTNSPYDPSIVGIVVQNPSISFEDTSQPGTKPVVSAGKVSVRVSSINGTIKKGDLITASTIPGVGQKATNQGYVIGTALQDYPQKDPKKIGDVLIALNISFNPGSGSDKNLLSNFKQALAAPYLSPLNALRYVLAALLIISSFAIAVFFFGKVSTVGVEAIGRNPLAGKMILLGVVFHLLLAAVIVAIGIGVAYFVLII